MKGKTPLKILGKMIFFSSPHLIPFPAFPLFPPNKLLVGITENIVGFFLLIHAIGHYMCTTGMYTLLSSMSIGYNDILNKKEKKKV